ncbi:hypothetical protein GDO86_008249 [Hymenochirus boettgeri]|uniref:Uncharacterized protein n=1 Tax=Hymenochirus boettgeri TaxID=247094 RepID=A0A8T2J227_9PIPI|nr:hypothetical protein GDO86_008249 [Hymenochirus boettgeri]
MAGKLNQEDVKFVLERLKGINRSLDSCIKSFDECGAKLGKSTQCQDFLNHCLKPIQTGFIESRMTKVLQILLLGHFKVS